MKMIFHNQEEVEQFLANPTVLIEVINLSKTQKVEIVLPEDIVVPPNLDKVTVFSVLSKSVKITKPPTVTEAK